MNKKSNILVISSAIALFVAANIMLQQQEEHMVLQQEEKQNSGLRKETVTVGGVVLQVELAETAQQQERGLSHRDSIEQGKGMLFTFNTEGEHPIWMKDMQFPIDIIWIDAEMRVVHIEQRVAPETYPQTFTSPSPAKYVLEVPAGYASGRITVNDMLLLKEKQE